MEQKPINAKPSFYAHCYEQLKEIARNYGYALLLHGSMNRDLDLVAIPWAEKTLDEFEMIKDFHRALTDGNYSDQKEFYLYAETHHGRKQYVINLNRGGAWNNYVDKQFYIDISVMPTKNAGG